MPLEEYVANYDAILESKPFKYGNMKGKVLNKSQFFNDHSDYEVLLRKDIPHKYDKYFSKEFVDQKEQKSRFQKRNDGFNPDNKGDDIEIEYARSNNINLSPIKSPMERGIKDSEVLLKKSHKNSISDTLDYLRSGNNTEKLMSTDYSLDLGNLASKQKPIQKNEKPSMYEKQSIRPNPNLEFSDSQFDDSDETYEQTFKKLNKSSLINDDGKEVNSMIMKLMENLKDLKTENMKLQKDTNDMKFIIKDLNDLASAYKIKLKSYYLENKSLKSKLQHTILEQPQHKATPSVNNLDSIDEQIKLLLKKKELLIQTSKQNVDLSSLSDDIVKKLMNQLKIHNSENHKEDECLGAHHNCPFCQTKPAEENLIQSLFSKDSFKSQESIIDLLAERLKSKMVQLDHGKDVPEIW